MIHGVGDFLYQFSAPDNSPCHYVGMAVEVLGATVHRKVKTPLRRPEIHRARKGVVNDGNETMVLCKTRDRFQIRHSKQRVGHGLRINHPGFRPQEPFPGTRMVTVKKIKRNPKGSQVFCDKTVGPPVQTSLHQEMIPGGKKRQEYDRNGGHAARRYQCGLRIFQGGQFSVECQMIRCIIEPDVP